MRVARLLAARDDRVTTSFAAMAQDGGLHFDAEEFRGERVAIEGQAAVFADARCTENFEAPGHAGFGDVDGFFE